MRTLVTLAAALLLAGCFRETRPWKPVEGSYDYKSGWFGPGFRIDLPQGWMAATEVEGLLASRDGFTLQQIKVRRFEAGKEMPHTRKTFTMAMRPQEIAEVMVDDVRSESDVKAVKLLETKPAQISGQTGFRAVIAFRDSDGMKFKAVLAGVLVGSDLWRLVYVAPERHYFELDLATFDAALASFRVKS